MDTFSLIAPAFAQNGGATGPGALEAFLPIVLIFVVFYFLLIRPQQKKMKQHREMLAAVRRGDRIVTGGGIIGTVSKVVDDNEVVVEITEGVKVRVQRALISSVLAKTQPPSDTREDKTPIPANDPATDPGKGSMLKKILGNKRE